MASKRARSKNTVGTRLTEISSKLDEQAAKTRGMGVDDLMARVAELEEKIELLSSSNYRVTQAASALEGTFPGLSASETEDWNTAVNTGFYWSATSALNNPASNLAVGVSIPYGPDNSRSRVMQEVWFPSTAAGNQTKSWRRVGTYADDTWTFTDWQESNFGTTSPLGSSATLTTLRITTAADASLVSTGHGLQIGPTNGVNMVIDGNEIMSRNNGEPNDLNFNIEGGTINLGMTGGPQTTIRSRLNNPFLPWAVAAGSANVTTSFPTVTLPSGRFTQPPIVTAQLYSGAGEDRGENAMVTNVTTTSFQCRHSGTSGTKTVHWQAIQMSSGSAGG